MPTVTFINHDGTRQDVDVSADTTVMQAAVDNMIEGITGECGGACSCATCHCYIDDSWLDQVAPAGDAEKDLLVCVLEPDHRSRLACQVVITDALDGLVVTLPASQY